MAWWIVGLVFRHFPDMAAITAEVVVHLCVFARSRKLFERASIDRPDIWSGASWADQREPIPMKITYSESHPAIMRIGTTTDHLTRVIFIARPDFSGPTKKRKHPNFAPGTKM